MPIAVMIIDSGAAMRARLACFVRKLSDFQVVAQAACHQEALEQMPLAKKLDLVLLGPGLPTASLQAVVGSARRRARLRVCLMTHLLDHQRLADYGADDVMPLPDVAHAPLEDVIPQCGNRDALAHRLRRLFAS